MSYDRWKTRSPDDGIYDPSMDDPPSREQQLADYLDEQLQIADTVVVWLRNVGDDEDDCWIPCAKGDPGAVAFCPLTTP